MKKLVLAALALSALTACQPANITTALRASDHESSSMQTRCEVADMRDNVEMAKVLGKYDGWRMIYVSEYTTGHRFGTDGVVCFERPKK